MEGRRTPRRIRREWRTVVVMVDLYCRAHHGTASRCSSCTELLEYARRRLDRCPYGVDKPTCANCPIHCYRIAERERMRQVMRWAGPRMLRRHPVLAILHLVDGRRPVPDPPRPRRRNGPESSASGD